MKKLIVLFVAFLMLVFCNATASQAVTLGFNPDFQGVLVGDQAIVDLVISGLEDDPANFYYQTIGTFDLDISFDSAILGFYSVTFGDQLDLGGLGSWTEVTPDVGTVNLLELSLDSPWDLEDYQADSFTVATLTFNTLVVGTSTLDIGINALGDAWANPLAADVQSGSIAPVPEPATLLLLGSGLAGLGFLRKKKKPIRLAIAHSLQKVITTSPSLC